MTTGHICKKWVCHFPLALTLWKFLKRFLSCYELDNFLKNHVHCTHLNVTRITKRTVHTPSSSTWRQTWPSRSIWNTCWKFVTRRPLLTKVLFSVESHQFTIGLAFTLCLTILERIQLSSMERKQNDMKISMTFKLKIIKSHLYVCSICCS